jgi:hypothetical protein
VAQHVELVAEHRDLDVLGMLAAEASKQHADESACHEVEEGQGHRQIISWPDPRCSTHTAGFLNPTPQPPPRPSTELGCHDLFDIVKGPANDPKLLRRLPRLALDALALVWAAGPRELLVSVALKVTGGLGLAVVLLLGRGVLAGVLAADQSGTSASTAGVLPRLVALTAIIATLGLVAALGREISTLLGTRTQRHAQGRIIDVACAVELEAYETPAFHDRLLRASLSGHARPMQLVDGLLGLLGAIIGILGVTGALLALEPWLVPLVLLAAVPLLASAAKAGEVLFGSTAARPRPNASAATSTACSPAKTLPRRSARSTSPAFSAAATNASTITI